MNKLEIFLTIILISIIFLGSFFYFNNKSDKVSENEQPSASSYSSGLYKPEKSFEGEKYCIFVFNEENAEYIVNKTAYKNFCNINGRYPQIQEFLYNEYKLEIEKSDLWQFPAWYHGDAEIVVTYKYKQAKNLDKYLAHEVAHSSTESLNLPTWFSEGIAEYSAYRFFGTQYKLTPFWFEGFEYWETNSSYANNIKGYPHAGYVVRILIEKYGVDAFKQILINLDGKIKRNDNADLKNELVVEAIRDAVNNQSLTLQDILHP